MKLDEAIQHCEEVTETNERICDTEPSIGLPDIYKHKDEAKKCASEHRQLAEWLRELKAYRETWNKLGMWLADTRLAIAPDEFLNDVDEELVRVAQVDMIDTVLEWMDEHEVEAKQNCTDCIIDGTDACSRGAGRAVDDEICGDFIPSRSEIPNTCGDAISRQAVLNGLASIAKAKARSDAQKSLMGRVMFFTERLPSVTPQQKVGRWIPVGYDGYADGNPVYDWWECSECGWEHTGDEESLTAFCPNCGEKMEVEE